jgi:hypothetical protein
MLLLSKGFATAPKLDSKEISRCGAPSGRQDKLSMPSKIYHDTSTVISCSIPRTEAGMFVSVLSVCVFVCIAGMGVDPLKQRIERAPFIFLP